MHPKRVGRLPGFEYKGRFTYFLTLCTFARRRRFNDVGVVTGVDRIFRNACEHMQTFGQRLWQTAWFDHIVRDDESVERHVCYTLANPVRAGLVDRWDRWPYSGTALPVSDEDFQVTLRARRSQT